MCYKEIVHQVGKEKTISIQSSLLNLLQEFQFNHLKYSMKHQTWNQGLSIQSYRYEGVREDAAAW